MESGAQSRSIALARSRRVKQNNAITAVACSVVPAVWLMQILRLSAGSVAAGFMLGLLWANAFEYVFHRWLLHLPHSLFLREHLRHHSSVGTPAEAEHVNLGGSPVWIALMFLVNGTPVIAADLAFGFGIAPSMLLAFAAYMIVEEEIHWRIHLGSLPRWLDFARAHHLAHHALPDSRYNIFFPLFDRLLGTAPVHR
jgi:hypothetical protein